MAPGESVVIIGAGSIGRGLVADVVSAAGLRPVFVARQAKGKALRQAGHYCIRLVGGGQSLVRTVSDYDVITTDDRRRLRAAIASCQFAATAVGSQNLPAIAPLLVDGLADRAEPLNILLCENAPQGGDVLAQALAARGASRERFSCVRSSPEPMVRSLDRSLDLVAERIRTTYVEAAHWLGPAPDIPGFDYWQDITPFYWRKLYTNNAGHALIAYMGAYLGCTTVAEAVQRAPIRRHLEDLLHAAGAVLVHEFGLNPEATRDHLVQLQDERYPNAELGDTIARLARDPLRKLGPGERLVGLLRLLQAAHLSTLPVTRVIGAALRYRDPKDPSAAELARRVRRGGPGAVLESVCGIAAIEPCFAECIAAFEALECRR